MTVFFPNQHPRRSRVRAAPRPRRACTADQRFYKGCCCGAFATAAQLAPQTRDAISSRALRPTAGAAAVGACDGGR